MYTVERFSVLSTGNTIERRVDSNGTFIERIIAKHTPEHVLQAKRKANRLQAIIDASLRHRAKKAKPVKFSPYVINALVGRSQDSIRKERQEDERIRKELASMTGEQRIAYFDNAWQQWGDNLLKDKCTVEAMQRFLQNDTPIVDDTDRAGYAELLESVNS